MLDFLEWSISYLAAFNKDSDEELLLNRIPQDLKLILFAIGKCSAMPQSDIESDLS